MNDKQRDRLREASQMLSSAITIADSVCDSEQDRIDNYPENLQGSERFENMEDAAEKLYDAIGKLEEAKSLIESAAR